MLCFFFEQLESVIPELSLPWSQGQKSSRHGDDEAQRHAKWNLPWNDPRQQVRKPPSTVTSASSEVSQLRSAMGKKVQEYAKRYRLDTQARGSIFRDYGLLHFQSPLYFWAVQPWVSGWYSFGGGMTLHCSLLLPFSHCWMLQPLEVLEQRPDPDGDLAKIAKHLERSNKPSSLVMMMPGPQMSTKLKLIEEKLPISDNPPKFTILCQCHWHWHWYHNDIVNTETCDFSAGSETSGMASPWRPKIQTELVVEPKR